MGSLFELVIAMTLVAVLSFISILGWQGFARSDQALITMQQMAAAIRFARMEAIQRGEPIFFARAVTIINVVGDGVMVNWLLAATVRFCGF